MITLQSKTRVSGVRGQQILDFLLNCTDSDYRRWWPGTHLHLRTLERHPGDVGNVVYMDELVGGRHLKLTGVVTELVPAKKLVWQMRASFRLPIWLVLELHDEPPSVTITHTIRAGFTGWGRLVDPVFRLYLSKSFARAMDDHVKTEFPRLGELLRGASAHPA